MAQSHCELWVHFIWATKEREPHLKKKYRWHVIEHIRNKSHEKNYHIDVVNGISDHLHALIAYKATHTISRIINDIKGESSHWINENDILKLECNFRWQGGYAAYSVSPSSVQTVRNYILNQEKHHKNFSLNQELRKFEKRQTKQSKR